MSTPGATGEQIEWCPKAGPVCLPFNGTSFRAVHQALTTAFGAFPIQLNIRDHERMLFAMVAAGGEGAAPYRILHDAIRKFGEIEVRSA